VDKVMKIVPVFLSIVKKFYFTFGKRLKRKHFKIVLAVLVALLVISSYAVFHKLPDNAANKTRANLDDQIKKPSEWTLSIKKLGISVPIVLNVSGADKDEYFAALQSGVAQMEGTALPGEGNTVIFGHSSYYKDDPGQYKKIFSTLDQLKAGDEIKILKKDGELTYIVRENKLFDPTDVEIVGPTDDKQLTLITCWPPGALDQRLVVIADLK